MLTIFLLVSVLLYKPIILLSRVIIKHLETQVLDNTECFAKEVYSNQYQSSVNNFFVILAIFIIIITSICFNGFYLLLGFLLLICGIIDFERRYLPEELTTLLLWSALILSALGFVELLLKESVFGAVSGFGFIFVLDCFLKATKRGAFGSGDASFLAAIGAWSGPLMVPLIFSLALLGHSKDGARRPFGHRLAMAGWACIMLRLILKKL
jgi:prepilin signal peptidase PulO-like enzyme (type II secretory pathway)